MQKNGSKYYACSPQPQTLGLSQKVIIQPFQNMVTLHIKLNGIRNAATSWQIFCPQTHHLPTHPLRPWGQASTFSEHGHVAYQIKGNHK